MTKHNIAVLDFETDPFKFGRIPQPFCVEFLTQDGEIFEAWGDNCVEKLIDYLDNLEKDYFIFAHNGGKFDFHFLHEYLDNPIKIINARIVSAKLFGHTLRDSFAIMPVPLASFEKTKIDYDIMERSKREKHKREILNYLHDDCVSLLKQVTAFIERFGLKLTVGSTAMSQLKKLHKFDKMKPDRDAYFRQFYFGGRVECFESGILKGPWLYIDVNSSYPKSMRDYRHPVNGRFVYTNEMPDDFEYPFFIKFKGKNKRAIPMKTADGLDFSFEEGIFHAVSHELEVALKYGLVEIDEVIECAIAMEYIQFEEYIDKFFTEKNQAELEGNKTARLFSKFMLNSAYGKFGQNPENFDDWEIIRDYGQDLILYEKGFDLRAEFPSFELWSKPSKVDEKSYHDVSIAASITSASRAILLEGLQKSIRPIYCDTDSIICEGYSGKICEHELGAFKIEAKADHAVIAGKKLYALYNEGKKEPVKLASKGGKLELKELIEIAKGQKLKKGNLAPTFSILSQPKFISRTFKMTVDEEPELCEESEPDEKPEKS